MFLSKQASEERSIGKRVNDVIDKRVKEMENKEKNRFLRKQATEEDWRMNSLAAGVVGGGLAGTALGSRAGRAIGSRPQSGWSEEALQSISAEEKEMLAKIQIERESDKQLVQKQLSDWDSGVGQDPSGEMSRQRVEQYGEQMIGVKDRARTDAMDQKLESMRANVEHHPSYQKRLLDSQRRGVIGGAIAGAGLGAAGLGLGARALYDHHHEKQAGNLEEELREEEQGSSAVRGLALGGGMIGGAAIGERMGRRAGYTAEQWLEHKQGDLLEAIHSLPEKAEHNRKLTTRGRGLGLLAGGAAGLGAGMGYEHLRDKEAFTESRDLMNKIAAAYAPTN